MIGAGQGVWKVLFDPIADIQHTYTIKAALNSEVPGIKAESPIILSNILFGDVWICSGQSNMKFTVGQVFYIYFQSCSLKTAFTVLYYCIL